MSKNWPPAMKSNALNFICIAVLCTVLTLGLWPFHSPRNQVFWMEQQNGIRFGRYGTAATSSLITTSSVSGASIEIWLQPRQIWDSGTFLAFYDPTTHRTLSLRQSQTDLLLQQQSPEDRRRRTQLDIEKVFQRSHSTFLTITGGIQGVQIYNNGGLAKASSRARLSPADLFGRVIIGDSPGQPDSWSGQFFGLAIYERELTANEVLAHYSAWTRTGRPTVDPSERVVASYLFNEHSGAVIHDQTSRAIDLQIPEKYQVVGKIVLEPFWSEFNTSRSYWSAVLKNIIGFIPLGFCFYIWWSRNLRPKRAVLATIVLGTAVSVTIEILQGFLPMRQSGTSDIVTNTLGTWIGIAVCRRSLPVLARGPRWLSSSMFLEENRNSPGGIRRALFEMFS
jgi:hypothetical protein